MTEEESTEEIQDSHFTVNLNFTGKKKKMEALFSSVPLSWDMNY